MTYWRDILGNVINLEPTCIIIYSLLYIITSCIDINYHLLLVFCQLSLVVIVVLFATVVIVIIIVIIAIIIGSVVSCTNTRFYNSSLIHSVTTTGSVEDALQLLKC